MPKYKGKIVNICGTTYLLGSQLGSGGNGYVCSATTSDNSAQYAVKFLNVDESDAFYSNKKERFLREIEYCEKTDSKYIIKIFGHGEFEKRLCYVMPYHSKTLRKIIEEEHDVFVLLDYCVALCEAVKYIHNEGVIHRDIKPENVLVGGSGDLVLADFGIAHFINSSLTKSGDWLGNKNYAAPEQLLKGNSNDVTVACDIYAFGAIVNELFTKQRPNGTKFATIADKHPYLAKLDDIVFRCLRQEPIERPSITTICNEIKLLVEELKNSVEDIQDFLWPIEAVEMEEREIETITITASFDVLSANYLFHEKTLDELEIYNSNYHRNICYNVDSFLKNVYFQHFIMQECKKKFAYEANVYSKGQTYIPLNLKKKADKALYKRFEEILDSHSVTNRQFDISGQILKTFSSCCDYHCRELIGAAVYAGKKAHELDCSPILYLVSLLRGVLDEDICNEILLEDYISINWDVTCINKEEDQLIVDESDDSEKAILEELKTRWQITFSKIDRKHHSVTFTSKEDYSNFKNYALEFSKADYVFEGDVLDVLRIKREYGGLVELQPLNDFDINYVLARLLGLKDDY